MACFAPLRAFRAPGLDSAGRSRVSFSPFGSYVDTEFAVPCGQCIGCRLERSRQWALRCMHEASLYERNCFLTLTYSDEFLPADGSLRFRDFQLFMKRLRFEFGSGIRFFHCGEYGDVNLRPHYHALLFNFDFDDKRLHAAGADGHRLYVSATLDRLWPLGFGVIGSVTFDSAAYVARYCVKKVTGSAAADHYAGRAPEYATMSRRPGIGAGWYERFKADVYPSDFVVRAGRRMRPPKAYDRYLEREDLELSDSIRSARVRESRRWAENNTKARLAVREEVQLSRLKQLPRKV